MIRCLFKGLQQSGQGSEPGKPVIAVAGALRSGTNYLKFLLEQNYDVAADSNAFGWKHGGVPVFAASAQLSYPDMPLAYIVKNPYAFVVSLHRYHQRKIKAGHRISLDAEAEFNAFLTSPVTIFDSQLDGSPQLRFSSPVQYWNFLYWNLETLDPKRFRVAGFNYEDLVTNPLGIRMVESVAGLTRRSEELETPKNQLKRLGGAVMTGEKSTAEGDEDFDGSYYTEKRYLGSFTDEQLAFMRAEIDPWLMQQRGYDIL